MKKMTWTKTWTKVKMTMTMKPRGGEDRDGGSLELAKKKKVEGDLEGVSRPRSLLRWDAVQSVRLVSSECRKRHRAPASLNKDGRF